MVPHLVQVSVWFSCEYPGTQSGPFPLLPWRAVSFANVYVLHMLFPCEGILDILLEYFSLHLRVRVRQLLGYLALLSSFLR